MIKCVLNIHPLATIYANMKYYRRATPHKLDLQVSRVVVVGILLRRGREHGVVEVVGGPQRDATAESDDRQDSASHNRRWSWNRMAVSQCDCAFLARRSRGHCPTRDTIEKFRRESSERREGAWEAAASLSLPLSRKSESSELAALTQALRATGGLGLGSRMEIDTDTLGGLLRFQSNPKISKVECRLWCNGVRLLVRGLVKFQCAVA